MTVTAARVAVAPTRSSTLDRFSVLLIALAAMLWVSDAYFRSQLVDHLSASQIVVMEDALVTLFLIPFLVGGWNELRRLNARQWLAVLIIGAGPQAIATYLFTQSFSHRVFAVTFLVQQTQPLIAITLAWILLGERRRTWFWPLAALALVGVYLVVFASDPGLPLAALQGRKVEAGAADRLQAGLLAFGAALLWAAGTVLGRYVLGKLSFQTTTAMRFTIALPVLVLLVVVQSPDGVGGFTHYQFGDFVPNLLYIAIVPGLIGLLLYYRGLASTPASLATIAELTLPVTITFLASAPKPWGFEQPLYFPTQLIGAALLLAAILALNWTKERGAVRVAADRAA